jgi:prevent-host-death family protein
MVNYMTMIVVNVFEAKAKLSEFLEIAAKGERVLICKRNRPIAELRAVEAARTEPRPLGLGRGRVTLDDAFFAPLPDEILDGFEGGAPEAPARVADRGPSDRAGAGKRRARRRTP